MLSPGERVLRGLGIESPDDIDLTAIAWCCGCRIKVRALDGCEARIAGLGDQAIISVKGGSRTERQRFSIGHELGHWMLHRGQELFLCNEADLANPWERGYDPETIANRFAADLLMPAFLFRPLAHERPVTFTTVDEMSRVFSVSRQAAALRFVEHGSSPAMLVYHEPSGRKWFRGSQKVDGNLWPHTQLSPDSDAYDILNGSKGHGRSILVDADDWINHPAAQRYRIQEHSVPFRGGVLTLLWWKDESMIDDLVG